MSRAADVRLCIAPPTAAGEPARLPSLRRASRTSELYLLWHLAMLVCLQWRARREPASTLALLVDLGSGALSRAERIALAEEIAEEAADPEPLESPFILEAACRWFCRLRLPTDIDEVMAGEPLCQRVGPSSERSAKPVGGSC